MLRVVEAFSGIGAQKQALLNAGIKHEIITQSDNAYDRERMDSIKNTRTMSF